MKEVSLRFVRFIKGAARNSPWLMIAIAIHAILGASAAVFYIAHEAAKEDTKAIEIGVSAQREQAEPVVQPEEKIDRKLVPKNEEVEIVSYEEETFQVTEPPEEQDLYLDAGDPEALDDTPPGATGGTSFGVGDAPGHFGTGVPSGLATRRLGGGGKGRRTGPTQGTERAVLEGLRWLVRHQNPDGSWGSDTLRERCTPDRPCIPAEVEVQPFYNEGLTGLALLAFLGAGYNYDSKQVLTDTAMGKQYTIGDVVKKGLKYLVDHQREDGSFSAGRPHLYNEALCTMAMTEAYGLTTGAAKRSWKRPAEKGVAFLVNAQKKSRKDGGRWGWRYESLALTEEAKAKGEIDDDTYFSAIYDVDISVTTWVIMALKSARISGLDVPEEVMQGGLSYARYTSSPDGLVGYREPEDAGKAIPGQPGEEFDYHIGTMSALGMLVRTFVEHDLDDPFLEAAAKHIVKDLPTVSKDKHSVDYYYWYYGSLALNQFDGPDSPRPNAGTYWNPWKKQMEDAIIELQDKSKERDVCSRGGWLVNDRWSHAGRVIYNTAINVLTLEVYYRYENAFGAGKRERGEQPSTVQASKTTPDDGK